jgi:hypothetical protein
MEVTLGTVLDLLEPARATADVERNNWGSVTQMVTPRLLRFSVQFDV